MMHGFGMQFSHDPARPRRSEDQEALRARKNKTIDKDDSASAAENPPAVENMRRDGSVNYSECSSD